MSTTMYNTSRSITANNSTRTACKSIARKICAFTGFMMLLATSALADFDSPIGVVVYLTVTVAMLAYGRTFDFQQR